jgi:general secretion pathway protein I
MSARGGFTLLEVLVAVVVLAVAIGALQRLITRSVDTFGADVVATRAMLLAQGLLAEAASAPPAPGRIEGTREGLRFEREVVPGPHPSLRQVRVRVEPGCELLEILRVARR